MKSLTALLVAALLSNSIFAQQRQNIRAAEPAVYIAANTIVDIELASEVRTDGFKEGDLVGFRVAQDVIAGGRVVIVKGALARAVVIELKRARRYGKGGEIAWVMKDVTAVNGQRVPLEFSYDFKGVKDHATVITGGVIYGTLAGLSTFGIGAPVGLLFGLRKGKEATLPAGKLFQAVVKIETLMSAEAVDTPTATRSEYARINEGRKVKKDRDGFDDFSMSRGELAGRIDTLFKTGRVE
ncbi:MAG TPA: hypothetical protein VEF04_13005 [Blastocatellia bacterium]|nr:hypothetical protein [Blastocatellia bacterium]